mmetsp:Transcript_121149/g.354026  ORF Transcript_121149/g.354026 Transcript_121149/m.354026 type:complete len:499 (-) Transcript_121149:443-1939(-)
MVGLLKDPAHVRDDALLALHGALHAHEAAAELVQGDAAGARGVEPREEHAEVVGPHAGLPEGLYNVFLAEDVVELLLAQETTMVGVSLLKCLPRQGDQPAEAWIRCVAVRLQACSLQGLRDVQLNELQKLVREGVRAEAAAEPHRRADADQELAPAELHVPEAPELVRADLPAQREGQAPAPVRHAEVLGVAGLQEVDPGAVGHEAAGGAAGEAQAPAVGREDLLQDLAVLPEHGAALLAEERLLQRGPPVQLVLAQAQRLQQPLHGRFRGVLLAAPEEARERHLGQGLEELEAREALRGQGGHLLQCGVVLVKHACSNEDRVRERWRETLAVHRPLERFSLGCILRLLHDEAVARPAEVRLLLVQHGRGLALDECGLATGLLGPAARRLRLLRLALLRRRAQELGEAKVRETRAATHTGECLEATAVERSNDSAVLAPDGPQALARQLRLEVPRQLRGLEVAVEALGEELLGLAAVVPEDGVLVAPGPARPLHRFAL